MAKMLNKRFFSGIILALGLMFRLEAIAQNSTAPTDTTPSRWTKNAQIGLNLNQASFSSNWKAGGVNSIAIGTLAQFAAKYQAEKSSFEALAQLNYGEVQNDGQGRRKTNDLIFLDYKYGYKIAEKWNLFASLNLTSQFASGFKFDKGPTGEDRVTYISGFMSPGYITEAAGLEYKPIDYASFRFGLGGLRHTLVLDSTLYRTVPDNYGVPIGERIRTQVIFQFMGTIDKNLMDNLNLKARYIMNMDYAKLNRLERGMVHRVDASLTAKVNKFVNVNLTGILLYDYDQDPGVQLSQALALGVLLKF